MEQEFEDAHDEVIISANLVKHSKRERDCAWCHKAIPLSFAYYRVVHKNGKFNCDSVCLNCWVQR